MVKAISVFQVTFKQWFRSPATVFFSILFPIILLVIFGAVFSYSGSSTYSLYVQDQDIANGSPTAISTAFVGALNHTNALTLDTVPSNVDARSYVQNLSSTQFFSSYRILIIPSGFQNATLESAAAISLNTTYLTLSSVAGNLSIYIPPNETASIQQVLEALKNYSSNSTVMHVNLTYYYDPSDVGGVVVGGIVSSVATAFNSQIVGASPIISTQAKTLEATNPTSVDYYLPGLIAAFVMINGIFGLTNITTDLRKRGVIRRLLSTPLSKLDWILGNILTQIVISLMLTIIMVAVAYLFFQIVAIPDPFTFSIIIVGVIAFSGLGMIFGGLVKNVETSSALANIVAFPMMFLSGSFFPLEITPPIVQTISKFMPLTYFSNALRSEMITKDMTSTFLNLGVTAAFALVFIAIGVWAIRWKEG